MTGILPPEHHLHILLHGFIRNGIVTEEHHISPLQGIDLAYIGPLGGFAFIQHPIPGCIEELEQQGIVGIVLIKPWVKGIVAQFLGKKQIVARVKIQAPAAEGFIQQTFHITGSHALLPFQFGYHFFHGKTAAGKGLQGQVRPGFLYGYRLKLIRIHKAVDPVLRQHITVFKIVLIDPKHPA